MFERGPTKQVSVRVPADLLRRFDRIADRSALKRNTLFVNGLELYVLLLEGGKVIADHPNLTPVERREGEAGGPSGRPGRA